MGMVLLDVQFRAERAFGVRMPKSWPEQLGITQAGGDATLATMHAFLLQLCRDQSVVPPQDSWTVLVKVIEAASGASASDLTAETLLVRDIAPFG